MKHSTFGLGITRFRLRHQSGRTPNHRVSTEGASPDQRRPTMGKISHHPLNTVFMYLFIYFTPATCCIQYVFRLVYFRVIVLIFHRVEYFHFNDFHYFFYLRVCPRMSVSRKLFNRLQKQSVQLPKQVLLGIGC